MSDDDEWCQIIIRSSAYMLGCVIIWVYKCIFTQLSHLYTPYTSFACLLLFKVAKPEPEPETRVWWRPNPKPGFGNNSPGLESLGVLSLTEIVRLLMLLFVKLFCSSFSLHNVADETGELRLRMSLRDP